MKWWIVRGEGPSTAVSAYTHRFTLVRPIHHELFPAKHYEMKRAAPSSNWFWERGADAGSPCDEESPGSLPGRGAAR